MILPSYFHLFLLAHLVVGLNGFTVQEWRQRQNYPFRSRICCKHASAFARSFTSSSIIRFGWIQGSDGEWEWQEDDANYVAPVIAPLTVTLKESTSTPTLPGGTFRPKQSLGQNFLRDANTVNKIIRAFHKDATKTNPNISNIIELGPGAGALTDPLVANYGTSILKCIEIDPRSIELLQEKHPGLQIMHQDVLKTDYPALAQEQESPLTVVGNLPYYITSQILFALADASHSGAVQSATVTMQWEVAQRMVAKPCTKDYGILSVVFQLYADTNLHFKIPAHCLLSPTEGGQRPGGTALFGTRSIEGAIGRCRPCALEAGGDHVLSTAPQDVAEQSQKPPGATTGTDVLSILTGGVGLHATGRIDAISICGIDEMCLWTGGL